MKTRYRASQKASVLLAVLAFTAIFALVAAYYFRSISQQHLSVVRSQLWNASIPLADAGIEDALSHLNKNCKDLEEGDPIPKDNGWNTSEHDSKFIEKSEDLGTAGSYRVVIDMTSLAEPKIYSEGYTPKSYARKVSNLGYASIAGKYGGVSEIGNKKVTEFLPRAVWVNTRKSFLFEGALAAKGMIDIAGNNLMVDSFDSTDPARSNNGRYKENVGDKGDVATNGDVVDVGNADIKGHVRTGPGGTIEVGANGSVGDVKWHQDGNTGIQDGWGLDDMNMEFPDAELPDDFSGGGLPLYNEPVKTMSTNLLETVNFCSGLNCQAVWTNGTVSVLTTNTISTTLPAFGTYVGLIYTNYGATTNASYPGDAYAPVSTNTTYIQNETTPPSSGSYLGGIITNQVKIKGKWTDVYSYSKITGYSYEVPYYTYDKITGAKQVFQKEIITTNTVVYDIVFDSGDYEVDTLAGSMLVRGNARVHVKSSFSLTGKEGIKIQAGASLELYMSGKTANLGGNGVMNEGGSALAFQYYGLPSNEYVSFGGNGQFTGTVYAPNASLQLNGGGGDAEDFVGAAVVKKAKLNGHFNIHYDEALGKIGPGNGYRITQWREVAVNKPE